MKCPTCNGTQMIRPPFHPSLIIPCSHCVKGEVNEEWYNQGQALRLARLDCGLTLREAAIAWKIPGMTLSNAEQGKISIEEVV